jgi:hypothetical protein
LRRGEEEEAVGIKIFKKKIIKISGAAALRPTTAPEKLRPLHFIFFVGPGF